MQDGDQIEAFLNGNLSEEEASIFRLKVEKSPELADELAKRSLEKQIVEELDRQHWLETLQDLQEEEKAVPKLSKVPKDQKTFTLRRIAVFGTIAASLLFIIWMVWPSLYNTPNLTNVNHWKEGDFNIKSFSNGKITSDFINGTWISQIKEPNNTTLELIITCTPNQDFTLEVTLFSNSIQNEGDKITAKGTYKVEEDQLWLTIEPKSIKNAEKADPFNAAAIEQWLKTKRLFTEVLTIKQLDEDYLIIQYSNTEGIAWNRKNETKK